MAKKRRLVLTIDFRFRRWRKDPNCSPSSAKEEIDCYIRRVCKRIGIEVEDITWDRQDEERGDVPYAEDLRPYNGDPTPRPQQRPLTPLERDIVTRVIADILFQLRMNGKADSLMWKDGNGGIRLTDPEEVRTLLRVRNVLEPRYDAD